MPGRTWFRSAWLPVVCWLLVIFGLSSIPDLGTREQQVPWSDKLAHACEYGILGFLFARALTRNRKQSRRAAVRVVLLAAMAGAVVGLVDEWYQTHTPGRSSGLDDVAADLIGATLGGVVWASGSVPETARRVKNWMAGSNGRRTS